MVHLRLLPFAAFLFPVPAAYAASFDCSKASTPFEHAICDNPELSRADEVLAQSFATALGGLGEAAAIQLRADQRTWLDFARRVCTADARPLTVGRYGARGIECLLTTLQTRSKIVEQSRMINGHRFSVHTSYEALSDPNEASDPDSYWRVASHETSYPVMDESDPLAQGFNAFVAGQDGFDVSLRSDGDDETEGLHASSDTSSDNKIEEIVGDKRISMAIESYWYGHGAAHGQWGVSYLHYWAPEKRALGATDLFAGENWQTTLRDLAWAQLHQQHGEWLQVEKAEDIAEIVIDPARWSFEDDYSLIIQFEPYEVSAYAYGAPTISIPWQKLEGIVAENVDSFRYGL